MSLIQYHVEERIAYITINRPEKRNALSGELVMELKEAFSKASGDAEAKVVVLRASGETFCAGADLAYLQKLQQFTLEENLQDSMQLMELFKQIYTLDKVVIAEVQGAALAGGCGLVSVCDYAFSVPDASFGYTEVRIGFIPAIVMVFLVRKLGDARARHLLLSGDLVSAAEMKAIGMLYEVVAPEELSAKVQAFGQKLIRQNSGQAMRTTRNMLAKIQDMGLEEALNFACVSNAEARASQDCQRGIAAFLNKEKLQW